MYFLYHKMMDSKLLLKLFDLIELLALTQCLQVTWNCTLVGLSAGIFLHKIMHNPQCINLSQFSEKYVCSDKY